MMLQFFMLATALYALFSEFDELEPEDPPPKRHELGTLGEDR